MSFTLINCIVLRMEYRDVVYGTYMLLVRLIEVLALIYRLQKTDYIFYMPYQHGIYIQYVTSMYTYVHSISYTYYIFLLMYSAYFNCSPPLTILPYSPLSLSLCIHICIYLSLFSSPIAQYSRLLRQQLSNIIALGVINR